MLPLDGLIWEQSDYSMNSHLIYPIYQVLSENTQNKRQFTQEKDSILLGWGQQIPNWFQTNPDQRNNDLIDGVWTLPTKGVNHESGT